MRDIVQWAAPAQLWKQATAATDLGKRKAVLRQPEILRFTTDSFMDDYMAMLEHDPAQLDQYIAQPETWRGPLGSPDPVLPVPGLVRRLRRLGLALARDRGGATPVAANPSVADKRTKRPLPFKLYQPAHQRFYLITASLVCARAGLPDRTIDSGRLERTTFVIRRLFPAKDVKTGENLPAVDQQWKEYALVSTPEGNGWVNVTNSDVQTPDVLVAGEEQLPLFATNYTEDDGRRRRILSGLIPVGKRELYMGAAPLKQDEKTKQVSQQGNLPKTARKILFRKQVTEPWKRLIDRAYAAKETWMRTPDAPFDTDSIKDFIILENGKSLKKTSRELVQTGSWYILLDLAEYLEEYLVDVWEVIKGSKQKNDLTDSGLQVKAKLLDALKAIKIDSGLKTELQKKGDGLPHPFYHSANVKDSLFEALAAIDVWRNELENATGSYNREKTKAGTSNVPDPTWPDFLFPLADIEFGGPQIPDDHIPLGVGEAVEGEALPQEPTDQKKKEAQDNIDRLVAYVVRALPVDCSQPVPPLPLAALPVKDTREGWFVIRCVFERPHCEPLETAIVSEPTRPFQLAGFFDPDAPARPIRIALPIDTTPAGLRKFDKNTAFMISDVLCGQMDRMKGLSFGDLVLSVLPWPFHKDLSVGADKGPCDQAGMICTLSIPIITICALILLIMIVTVLDAIFHWIPWFITCFSLPGFKAKKASGS